MKFKSFIYILTICLLGFIHKPGLFVEISQIDEPLENIKGFQISERDNSEDRYTDFNLATISEVDRTVNPYRNTYNGLSVRNLNNVKRNYNIDIYTINTGKIFLKSGTTPEVNTLKLFPSGLLADRSFFISLRKFFV